MIAAAGLRKFHGTTASLISTPMPRWPYDCRHRFVFNTRRQEFVRITDEIAAIVKRSGVMVKTTCWSAMHITSGASSTKRGLIHDFRRGSRSSRWRVSTIAIIRRGRQR
jgi:hypothetical protein